MCKVLIRWFQQEVVCGSQETSSRGHGRDTHDLLTYLFTRLQRDLWQVSLFKTLDFVMTGRS